jgi:multiple antibiotic resistance protein
MPTLEFVIVSISTLIVMLDPIGNLPVFVSMTGHQTVKQSRRTALRAMIAALFVLLLFAGIGKFIFSLFSISLDSLRIVGGILFFLIGHEMMRGKFTSRRSDRLSDDGDTEDVAISPLGVPLICGPGAITTVMLLMSQADSALYKGLLFGVILLVAAIMFVLLVSARLLVRILGDNGINLLMRVMGLIMMVYAAEMFFGGLTPIVQKMTGN